MALSVIGVFLQSCSTAQSHQKSMTQHTGTAQKGTGFTASEWKPVSGVHLKDTWHNHKLPSAYEVYQLDPAAVSRFFTAFQQAGQVQAFTIPLPESIGPQTFTTKDAGILSAELREKYPNLYNLSGNTTTNLAHIRLNYDGQYMTAMITYQNKTFLLLPWEATNGSVYYLLYNKNNTNETKSPFENGEKTDNK
ncbi:hypothetical protein D3C71_127830 [compost metagenome]